MKETRSNKKMITAICGLIAIAVIAGSLAYWNQTHTLENPFNTGEEYSTTIIEDFNPGDGENWQPGVEVDKVVRVANTGDQDVIIRAKMDERWVRTGESTPYKALNAETDKTKVYTANQANPTDGLTAADDSVVVKKLSNSTNWIDGGDGWYYYKLTLTKGQTTDNWLEKVELLDNADMGAMEAKTSVTTDAIDNNPTWETYTGKMPSELNGKPVLHAKSEMVYKTAGGVELVGYINSDYTLSVTTQSVQATKEAVAATFGLSDAQISALGVTWTYAD